MESPAPGQFDFSQQRRTFRLDLLRSVPEGLLTTAFTTFAVYVAIRFLNLPPWMKGLLLGSGSVGLLLSLFVVQIVRRIGWPVNRMAAILWLVAAAGFLVAAFSGGSQWTYFTGVCLAAGSFGAGSPLMSQIYRKHYEGHNRGRLFSWSSLVRTCLAAAAGWGFGLWAEGGNVRQLFVVYALSCVGMVACVQSMAPVRLRASNRIQWFDAFQHAAADRPFRKLLIVWMVFGFGNLISLALFVEFIGNPRYGFALGADRSGLITSTIPMLVMMITVVPWGWVFDRLPFYMVRAVVNGIFVAGILVYFLGGTVTTLMIGIAVHGIARSGGEVLWSLWTTRFADSERLIEYQSVHTFLTGVRGVLAPLLAFAVVGLLGPVSVAWISSVLMLGSTLIILPEILAEWRARKAS